MNARVEIAARWKLLHLHKKRYITTADARFLFEGIVVGDCDIFIEKRLVGRVRKNRLTIFKGYVWNGMSFYRDNDDNKMASLLHDFIYHSALIKRKVSDIILHSMIRPTDGNHCLIKTAVRGLGWMFYGKKRGVNIQYK
jgi:hypothetical protein